MGVPDVGQEDPAQQAHRQADRSAPQISFGVSQRKWLGVFSEKTTEPDQVPIAGRPGESRNYASHKNTNGTQRQPAIAAQKCKALGAANLQQTIGADSQAHVSQARGGQSKRQAGKASKGSSGSTGARALQAVQARLVGGCGADSQRAGHTLCMPVLPEVAPRSGSGPRFQEDAPRAVESTAPRGGIGKQWHAH